MGGVVVDVQAAQSRAHAERGIARYTVDLCSSLERLAPDLVDAYAISPNLPITAALEGLIRSGKVRRVDELVASGREADVFHVSSPIEPVAVDALLPRPVVGSSTRVLATVYDLIPLLYPEVYLVDDVVRAGYRTRLGLVQSADHLLAISDTTAADVTRLLEVDPRRITPIFGGAGRGFEEPTLPRHELLDTLRATMPIEDQFVLVPSGIEWRKNLDRLLQAYAALPAALRNAYQLVIQCRVLDAERAELLARAAALGVGERMLLTGFVSDEVLVRLYQTADLVVFPSLYEGLGLPVLEARRCGAPVVCSATSSLVEIVPNPLAHFDPTSVDSMTERLEAVLADERTRAALRSEVVPERFDWGHAAARYAEALSGQQRLVGPAGRPSVAIVSPVPPQPCGPATYADHLIEALAQRWDVTVFVTIDPADVQLRADVRIEPLSLLDKVETFERRFDEVVYFFGNSEFHQLYPVFLRRRRGVAVLHDARLSGMYTELCAGRPDILGDLHSVLHRMYPGRYPDAMGGAGYLPPDEAVRAGVLMVQDVVDDASRVLCHSSHAAQLVELDTGVRPDVAFELPYVPFTGTRRRVDGLIVSFGLVAPPKQSDLLVEALAHIPSARLALVGPITDSYRAELESLAATVEVSERLTITGEVSAEEYRHWLERAAVGVQLRRWSNGESSAAVADTLAAGVPTVVSEVGTFHEMPDELVVKVEPDVSARALGSVIAALLDDPDGAEEMGGRGRLHASRHTYADAAKRLDTLLFSERRRGVRTPR